MTSTFVVPETLLERIEREYDEQPGLNLTPEQAQRSGDLMIQRAALRSRRWRTLESYVAQRKDDLCGRNRVAEDGVCSRPRGLSFRGSSRFGPQS